LTAQNSILPDWHTLKSISVMSWLIILALPCINLITILILRNHAGPFWMWSNLDPDYFYVLDSLNMINLNWPGVYHHPGTPVQFFGAIAVKVAHPLTSSKELTQLVLQNPEYYLGIIHASLVVLNTLAMVFAGVCAHVVFGGYLAALFIQFGPFISKLCIKWMTHVAPEPMLISTVLVLGGVALLALRPGQLEHHKTRYAIVFGFIAGFGMAIKITSIGIYFLPFFILYNFRYLAIYGLTTALSIFIFTLPAIGNYGIFIAHIQNISVGNPELGTVIKPFIVVPEYLHQIKRVSSRPAIFMVFFFGLLTTIYFLVCAKIDKVEVSSKVKLIAGICLADVVQVLVVAKHPSGHYMVPVLALSTLGIALLYQIWMDRCRIIGSNALNLKISFIFLFIALVGVQTNAGIKLDTQFKLRVANTLLYDDTRFTQCARIYFWAAATPSYPLQIGDDMAGHNFAKQLSQIRPKNDFWYEVARKEFRDWKGIRDAKEIVASYPCIYIRGSYPAFMREAIKLQLPAYTFSEACSAQNKNETIFTSGVDCMGNLEK
jgi:hypothetical protein